MLVLAAQVECSMWIWETLVTFLTKISTQNSTTAVINLSKQAFEKTTYDYDYSSVVIHGRDCGEYERKRVYESIFRARFVFD